MARCLRADGAGSGEDGRSVALVPGWQQEQAYRARLEAEQERAVLEVERARALAAEAEAARLKDKAEAERKEVEKAKVTGKH